MPKRVFQFGLYMILCWLGALLVLGLFNEVFFSALSRSPHAALHLVGSVIDLIFGLLWLASGPVGALIVDRRTFVARERQAEVSEKRRAEERYLLKELVNNQHVPLRRNLRRAVKRNDYGAVIKDTRQKAVEEFLSSFDLPRYLTLEESIPIIASELRAIQSEDLQRFDFSRIPADGIEFEHWVAKGLSTLGWKVKVTPPGGDQGIDVLAQKSGVRVGLQCKLYSKAVGNSAVQEASAGRNYYAAHKVAVVTTVGYTTAAKELADANNVILLLADQLQQADQYLLN